MAEATVPIGKDNTVIEGALTTIEQAIADIRADLTGGEQAPVPGPGDLNAPPVPPQGKSPVQQFMGA